VVGWTRERGAAFLLFERGLKTPGAYGEVNPMRSDPQHFWLGHLVVDPSRRGRGIGRQLTRGLIGWACRRLGARRLTLVVFPENEPAIRCYQKCGFRSRGEEFHAFGGDPEQHRMLRLELTPSRSRDRRVGGPRSNCASIG
jgi:RimJ/RimL family protein N-acetyltransferase